MIWLSKKLILKTDCVKASVDYFWTSIILMLILNFSTFHLLSFPLSGAQWLGCWIINPKVLCSKPQSSSKVNSAIHSLEVNQMNTRNIWELSG